MKAVVWTDVFQCGIMVAGILAVCILVGGIYSNLYEEEKQILKGTMPNCVTFIYRF